MSKPATLSPAQIEKDFKTAYKAVNGKPPKLTYTGARGWFTLDGENIRGTSLTAEGQKLARKAKLTGLFQAEAKAPAKRGRPAGSKNSGPKQATEAKAPAANGAAKKGPGRPRKDATEAPAPAKAVSTSNGAKGTVTVKLSPENEHALSLLGNGDVSRGVSLLTEQYRKTSAKIAQKAMQELAEAKG